MVWNRLRFPNMMVTYIPKHSGQKVRSNQHIFRVDPKYTKNDIKEYLTKIYNLPVKKVNTMNYEGKSNTKEAYAFAGIDSCNIGKFKRAFHGKHVYKEKDFKKAVVTLDTKKM